MIQIKQQYMIGGAAVAVIVVIIFLFFTPGLMGPGGPTGPGGEPLTELGQALLQIDDIDSMSYKSTSNIEPWVYIYKVKDDKVWWKNIEHTAEKLYDPAIEQERYFSFVIGSGIISKYPLGDAEKRLTSPIDLSRQINQSMEFTEETLNEIQTYKTTQNGITYWVWIEKGITIQKEENGEIITFSEFDFTPVPDSQFELPEGRIMGT